MEEILSRFPNIGDDIFKELDSKDFCKSKEVSRSWSHFISNSRAYKKGIQDKIQALTEEIDGDEDWKRLRKQPFHLAAKKRLLATLSANYGKR